LEYIELITMACGGLMGFIFKMMAQNQADRAKQTELAIAGVEATDNSQDKASKRSGKFPRIFIVITMFSILALLTVGGGLFDIPVSFITEGRTESYLFGLFEVYVPPVVTQIKGMIYDDTVRYAIFALIGYYFGQGTASRS